MKLFYLVTHNGRYVSEDVAYDAFVSYETDRAYAVKFQSAEAAFDFGERALGDIDWRVEVIKQ